MIIAQHQQRLFASAQQQRRPLVAPAAAATHRRAPTSAAAASAARGRGLCVAVRAAKKGGKGGGGGKDKDKKKAGGALADLLKKKEAAAAGGGAGAGGADDAALATPAQYADPEVNLLLLAICQSYWKSYKEYLVQVDLQRLAEALWRAPFVLLAHNKFEGGAVVDDPVYVYANRAALRLFEATWDELVGLPSRRSAAPEAQADRDALIARAVEGGAIEDYEGWRVSLKGRRFKIRGARFFNVEELGGDLFGQAVVFDRYEEEDGTVVMVQGDAPPAAELPPTEEDLAAAEAAVAEQAAAVRALKEQPGMTNQSPEVAAAVAELKARKEAQAALQQRWQEMVGSSLEDTAELDEDDG